MRTWEGFGEGTRALRKGMPLRVMGIGMGMGYLHGSEKRL